MDKLDPSTQKWIAENLIAGCTAEQLIGVLVGLNVPTGLATTEVAAAQGHPYMQAAMESNVSLKKRDSLLRTLDYYQRMDPEFSSLKRKKLPPFKKFLSDYLYRNRPGLFKNAVDHWPAMQWTPRKLVDKIGADTMVQVQHGRDKDKDYEMNSPNLRQEIRFGDFIDLVESKVTNDVYLTANNLALENSTFNVLTKDVENIGDGYLDPALTARRMFLWIGPKGIITPLHHDLTHNIFIQIYGRKRFRLIPSMQVPYMYNHLGVFSRIDLLDPKPEEFPLFDKASIIDVTLEPGDFLYIPLGWWHHVMGETSSISLSFTNTNAPNYVIDYPG